MSRLWSLKSRILYVIVALVLLTVGSTLVVLHGKMRDAAARGDYLDKHMSRFLSFQDSVRGSVEFAVRTLARDADVLRALHAGDKTAMLALAEQARTELSLSMPYDAVCFLGPYAEALACAGNIDQSIFSSKALDDLRAARFSTGLLEAKPGGLYLYAAYPVTVQGELVGGLFLAAPADSIFADYKQQSDNDKTKQHELMFVVDGAVAAATFPRDDFGELTKEFHDTARTTMEGDTEVRIFDLRGTTRDYHLRVLEGVGPGGHGVLGDLVLFRVRTSYDARVYDNLLPVLYVGFGGVAAAIVLAFLLAGTITRPINRFRQMVGALASGEADLSQRIPVRGADEIAALGRALNELLEGLNRMVFHIRDSSLALGSSAQEISLVSTRMLEGAQDQVHRIENSTSQVNELSRTIQEISQRANDGARMATEGQASVESTDQGMERLRKAMDDAWMRIRKLEENVKNIGKIAEMINRITEENTVLALNASIEAARAGAAGQGFAVVAQEMQQQARRVERNSKEIIENIGAVQRWTSESVRAMEVGRSEVDNGGSLVNVTLHRLSEISSVMGETAEAVKEQAIASDDIVQMMREVQRIANEALQASQQSVEEGNSIRNRARDLSGLVGRFKVREVEAPRGREKGLLPAPEDLDS
ncbi:MAG: methyl-accepting chemotaxis protein [Pseudomonadota bacterium]